MLMPLLTNCFLLPLKYIYIYIFDKGHGQPILNVINTVCLSPPQLRDPEERPGVYLWHGRLQLYKLWAGPQQEDPQFTEGLQPLFYTKKSSVDMGAHSGVSLTNGDALS